MSLLSLPTELRHEIYSHLISAIGVYSRSRHHFLVNYLSHKPPPSALQCACRFLYNDTMVYFYTIATVISVACIAPETTPSYSFSIYDLRAIRRARKVEISIYWEKHTKTRELDPWNRSTYMETLVGWLEEEAHELDQLTVGMVDSHWVGPEWHVREVALAPLRLLRGRARFVVVRQIYRGEEPTRTELQEYLMELNESEPGVGL